MTENDDEYNFYDPDTWYKQSNPRVIDQEPRRDEDEVKLPEPKEVSKIEGDIISQDEKRHIVFTGVENATRGSYNRIYDVSGEKTVLIASGKVVYNDGMLQKDSVLYKLDENNKPKFLTRDTARILHDGWFEKFSEDNNSLFLCKDAGNGTYRRIMEFPAVSPGGRTILADGTIVDELDRSDWYHRYEYKYDEKNNTLKFIGGEGHEPSEEDEYSVGGKVQKLTIGDAEITAWNQTNYPQNGEAYDTNHLVIQDIKSREFIFEKIAEEDRGFSIERNDDKLLVIDREEGKAKTFDIVRNEKGVLQANIIGERPITLDEKYALHKKKECLNGTFYQSWDGSCSVFVADNKENKELAYGNAYCELPVYNGLAEYYFTNVNGKPLPKGVYDFTNSCYRDDLEAVVDLGNKFYGVKKKGEEQFGIYEMADTEMKKPLMMVDSCRLIETRDSSGGIDASMIYTRDRTTYRYKISEDGKFVPIAKQKDNTELFLSTGKNWKKIELKPKTHVYITESRGIVFEGSAPVFDDKGEKFMQKHNKTGLLSNDKALKFALFLSGEIHEGKDDKPVESYLNAKEELKNKLRRQDKYKVKKLTDESEQTYSTLVKLRQNISESQR